MNKNVTWYKQPIDCLYALIKPRLEKEKKVETNMKKQYFKIVVQTHDGKVFEEIVEDENIEMLSSRLLHNCGRKGAMRIDLTPEEYVVLGADVVAKSIIKVIKHK